VTSVVIDPSVYVSALIGQPGSAPDLVVRAAIDDKLTVVVCPLLIRELESVLARSKFRRYVTNAQAKEYAARIRRHAIQVDDPPAASGLTRDPADDYLVSLGRESKVDAIISLDLDLLEAGLTDPPAWTPRQLVELLSK
jgi:putative PIN family toxin of toxin-antitoxin system